MEYINILLLPAVLSAVSAYLTAQVAFRKYKKEKGWDDKREKYSLVIESVEYLASWYASKHCAMGIGSTLNNFNESDTELNNSKRIIQKYAKIGEFYFSKKFSNTLTELYEELEKITYQQGENFQTIDDNPQDEFYLLSSYYASIANCTECALTKLLKTLDDDLLNM